MAHTLAGALRATEFAPGEFVGSSIPAADGLGKWLAFQA
jgi:hypothetical protein